MVIVCFQACIYENEEKWWPETDPHSCLSTNPLDSIELIGSDPDSELADLYMSIDWSKSVAK